MANDSTDLLAAGCTRKVKQAIAALGNLAQTSRRFYGLVQPLLYEEPFVLVDDEQGCFEGDSSGLGVYKLIRTLLGEEEEKNGLLSDLVTVYRE